MRYYFAAVVAAATTISLGTPVLGDIPPASGLANVSNLHAVGISLRGSIERTTSCNQVGFVAVVGTGGAQFQAVQIANRNRGCLPVEQWLPASTTLPRALQMVTVFGKNGTFKVPVQH